MPESGLRDWRSVGAWDGITPTPGRFGAQAGAAGVTLQPFDYRALATIIVREGKSEAFDAFVCKRWNLSVPDTGMAVFGAGGTLVWSAPHQYLAVARDGGSLDDLSGALRDVAAVTQQGDGRALVEIGGSSARKMLAKLFAIDLHPQAFSAGHVAVTAMVHGSVQIWLQDDAPRFVLASPRTFAGSTWRALTSAAAEYGCEVRATI